MKYPVGSLPKTKLSPRFYLDLPENPGVYIYFKDKTPIYIGKAINLKKRVASYFRLTLEVKTKRMIEEADAISYIKVVSELEALLLEAKLIRLYQPKYNIISKDDKHPLYISITKETYPRVITVRKTDLNIIKSIASFGPFPSSGNVKFVLKLIRRIFPYSDHKIGKRACLYSQIGLCDPCPNDIEKIESGEFKNIARRKYLKNIRNIKSFLDGHLEKVRQGMEKEMKINSKNQDFEQAAEMRNKIQKLEYITSPKISVDSYLENPNLYEDVRQKELAEFKKLLIKFLPEIKKLKRIECFDVAHLHGESATASMVTFIEGTADKSFYRHFRIRQKNSQDDYESMREVARRRKKNLEAWGKPDLIVVDGGAGQLSIFLKEFAEDKIPVIGLAKKFETLVIPGGYLGTTDMRNVRLPKGDVLNLVQRIRNEAHRFAQAYHHKLFARSLFEKDK
ncbi:hypothetical protein A2594_01265 [Candidatus Woesebacteria bacterium RIFOXYD1_FULL_41_28]|uniref:Excinuclease ABC subunit C n=1 Tax=Candidatus Woesebacteria bacterium RIFOXYD1_FULL_41_28 TaxID=1802550 RepID=A0A1F8DHZ2_9BACT|nr:MAG: hypothetical protein A2594_01265 [Candidatus Woesebacteria bacterium RIFOXYD1_FULL_41_28]